MPIRMTEHGDLAAKVGNKKDFKPADQKHAGPKTKGPPAGFPPKHQPPGGSKCSQYALKR